MKKINLEEALSCLWESNDFCVEKLVVQMRLDGGVDTGGIRKDDVCQLLKGEIPKKWDQAVLWSRELLSCYKILSENQLSRNQIVVGLFCACVLSESARMYGYDFGTHNDATLKILSHIPDDELTEDYMIFLLDYIFGMRERTLPLASGLQESLYGLG